MLLARTLKQEPRSPQARALDEMAETSAKTPAAEPRTSLALHLHACSSPRSIPETPEDDTAQESVSARLGSLADIGPGKGGHFAWIAPNSLACMCKVTAIDEHVACEAVTNWHGVEAGVAAEEQRHMFSSSLHVQCVLTGGPC